MKAYIERLQTERTPHERRQFAMRFAGVITAFIFVAWVSTLGVRLANNQQQPSQNLANTAATLIAAGGATTTLGY